MLNHKFSLRPLPLIPLTFWPGDLKTPHTHTHTIHCVQCNCFREVRQYETIDRANRRVKESESVGKERPMRVYRQYRFFLIRTSNGAIK